MILHVYSGSARETFKYLIDKIFLKYRKEITMEQARKVYQKIIDMLDNRDWKYERHDEDLVIVSGATGEDLPIHFLFVVKPKNHIIQFLSRLPVTMPEEKRIDGAIAACAASNQLIDGSFDYDVMSGDVTFRLTSSYLNSDISEELYKMR